MLLFCLAFLLLYLIAMSSLMLTVSTGAVDSPGKQDLAIAGVSAFTEVICDDLKLFWRC
jgi:hypothetical protein